MLLKNLIFSIWFARYNYLIGSIVHLCPSFLLRKLNSLLIFSILFMSGSNLPWIFGKRLLNIYWSIYEIKSSIWIKMMFFSFLPRHGYLALNLYMNSSLRYPTKRSNHNFIPILCQGKFLIIMIYSPFRKIYI